MNDMTALSGSVGALLKARGETIAVAETSAGGLVSASLLAIPGSFHLVDRLEVRHSHEADADDADIDHSVYLL